MHVDMQYSFRCDAAQKEGVLAVGVWSLWWCDNGQVDAVEAHSCIDKSTGYPVSEQELNY